MVLEVRSDALDADPARPGPKRSAPRSSTCSRDGWRRTRRTSSTCRRP